MEQPKKYTNKRIQFCNDKIVAIVCLWHHTVYSHTTNLLKRKGCVFCKYMCHDTQNVHRVSQYKALLDWLWLNLTDMFVPNKICKLGDSKMPKYASCKNTLHSCESFFWHYHLFFPETQLKTPPPHYHITSRSLSCKQKKITRLLSPNFAHWWHDKTTYYRECNIRALYTHCSTNAAHFYHHHRRRVFSLKS